MGRTYSTSGYQLSSRYAFSSCYVLRTANRDVLIEIITAVKVSVRDELTLSVSVAVGSTIVSVMFESI